MRATEPEPHSTRKEAPDQTMGTMLCPAGPELLIRLATSMSMTIFTLKLTPNAPLSGAEARSAEASARRACSASLCSDPRRLAAAGMPEGQHLQHVSGRSVVDVIVNPGKDYSS